MSAKFDDHVQVYIIQFSERELHVDLELSIIDFANVIRLD